MTKSSGSSSDDGTDRIVAAAPTPPPTVPVPTPPPIAPAPSPPPIPPAIDSDSGDEFPAAVENTKPPSLHTTEGQEQVKTWWLPACAYHPLSEQATIGFLLKAADASVMGLVTLSALCATFLLAWGRPGTACIPKLMDIPELTEPSWVQVLFAALPFAIFPATLYVSGLVQAAEEDGHGLGAVSTLCLIEFIAAIAIGSGMMVCITGSHWSLIVAFLMIVLTILTWAFTFKYPNCLRSFIWSTCFRQEETVASAHVADGGNGTVAVVVN